MMHKSKIKKRLPEPQPNSEPKADGTSVRPDKPNVGSSLIMERKDLQENKKGLNFENVGLFDFYSTALSIKQINKASLIVFKDDDGKVKELKNRYATW